ncbi:MAG: ThuA domain-containing protein [Planctomycetota bacterium]|nr:MAG: ThuA domain-containing protein [Planctomycetota bacterium]
MKRNTSLLIWLFLTALICSCSTFSSHQDFADKQQENIKVVVVTAGHDFEREQFFAIFDSFDNIKYVEAEQKDDSEIFEDIAGWDYDVMVLYNMTQKISPKRQANFKKLLDKGVGLVGLHHSIANFQDWPEYRNIIGAKYYLKVTTENGVTYPRGQYKHDVDINVHIRDPGHPVTHSLSDFSINDETYTKYTFDKGSRVLLTTDHPLSNKELCWVRNYANARVCFIQLGHGPRAYANPNYRTLVSQAINFCAGEN